MRHQISHFFKVYLKILYKKLASPLPVCERVDIKKLNIVKFPKHKML